MNSRKFFKIKFYKKKEPVLNLRFEEVVIINVPKKEILALQVLKYKLYFAIFFNSLRS